MDETFTSKVDVEIDYGSQKPQGFDYESHSSKTEVKYRIRVDLREWGIDDICVYGMDNQTLQAEIELQDLSTEDGDTEHYTFKINLKEMDVDTDNLRIKSGSGIMPSTLSLTLENVRKVEPFGFEADATGTLIFDSGSDD